MFANARVVVIVVPVAVGCAPNARSRCAIIFRAGIPVVAISAAFARATQAVNAHASGRVVVVVAAGDMIVVVTGGGWTCTLLALRRTVIIVIMVVRGGLVASRSARQRGQSPAVRSGGGVPVVILIIGTNAQIFGTRVAVVAGHLLGLARIGAGVRVVGVAVVAFLGSVDDAVPAERAIAAAGPTVNDRSGRITGLTCFDRMVPAARGRFVNTASVDAAHFVARFADSAAVAVYTTLRLVSAPAGRVARVGGAIIVIVAIQRRMFATPLRRADVYRAGVVVFAIVTALAAQDVHAPDARLTGVGRAGVVVIARARAVFAAPLVVANVVRTGVVVLAIVIILALGCVYAAGLRVARVGRTRIIVIAGHRWVLAATRRAANIIGTQIHVFAIVVLGAVGCRRAGATGGIARGYGAWAAGIRAAIVARLTAVKRILAALGRVAAGDALAGSRCTRNQRLDAAARCGFAARV